MTKKKYSRRRGRRADRQFRVALGFGYHKTTSPASADLYGLKSKSINIGCSRSRDSFAVVHSLGLLFWTVSSENNLEKKKKIWEIRINVLVIIIERSEIKVNEIENIIFRIEIQRSIGFKARITSIFLISSYEKRKILQYHRSQRPISFSDQNYFFRIDEFEIFKFQQSDRAMGMKLIEKKYIIFVHYLAIEKMKTRKLIHSIEFLLQFLIDSTQQKSIDHPSISTHSLRNPKILHLFCVTSNFVRIEVRLKINLRLTIIIFSACIYRNQPKPNSKCVMMKSLPSS